MTLSSFLIRALGSAAFFSVATAGVPAVRDAPAKPVAAAASAPTVQQILDRSVSAHGGYEAWRRIETLVWVGHLESTRSPIPSLPFRLEEKTPKKSRFEINEPSQRSIRVFNGTVGWKMRNGQDGKPDIQKFTPQEIRFAREAVGLEGPVIELHLRASAAEFALEGMEELEGHPSWRLSVRLASGERQHVWVDAKTYLETRYDRTAYGSNGGGGVVTLRYQDYREVEGLAVPSLIEIGGVAGGKPDRMVIEKVALNPQIDDRDFGGLGDPRGRAPEAAPPVAK
jgi:hypothetical protein